MSKKTRSRRIRNLQMRIAEREAHAKSCLGLYGGYCRFPADGTYKLDGMDMGYTTTDLCFNHAGFAKIRYERMKRNLSKLLERDRRLDG